MIAANLFHEQRDPPISAFVSQSPYPGRLHAACTGARLAPTNDPIRDTCIRLELKLHQRAKCWLVGHELDACPYTRSGQNCPAPLVTLLIRKLSRARHWSGPCPFLAGAFCAARRSGIRRNGRGRARPAADPVSEAGGRAPTLRRRRRFRPKTASINASVPAVIKCSEVWKG